MSLPANRAVRLIQRKKIYTLKNIGETSFFWGVDHEDDSVDWLDLDPAWGELEPNETTTMAVRLNENATLLVEGIYTDTVIFTNMFSGQEQQRGVTLTIETVGWVWTDPNDFQVEVIEGTQLSQPLILGNIGPDDLQFTLRTRHVAGSAQSEGASVPPDRDFSRLENAPFKPGELIVRFAPQANGQELSKVEQKGIVQALGGSIRREFQTVPGLCVVTLAEGMTVEESLVLFNQSDDILYAEANYELKADSTFPNDARFGDLWGMHNTGQSGGTIDADIDAPEAWDLSVGSDEIVVAVIDTGIDYNHPDLNANMWVNEAEFNGVGGVDDDGNGYVDDIYGYDFRNNDGNPMDDHYHGTHCAGTVGAVGNNGIGVVGVCWNVKLMAVKFLGSSGSGSTEDAIASVEYCTLMGVDLMSNSWGGGSYSQGLKDAIEAAGAAGILFIASAGNDGVNNDNYPHYPSSYNSENVIAVLSTDRYDHRSDFSNYGLVSVDLGAPGTSILSCEPGSGYQYLNGTSMAAPHVSGACALLWSMNPALGHQEIKEILLQTVNSTLPNLCVSEGRMNLYQAMLQTRVPWLELDPETGTIESNDTQEITVTFDASTLTTGTYEAEIVILSNDPFHPTKVVPVTMTVVPDDLVMTPPVDFTSQGTQGGPFTPDRQNYTLRNQGAAALEWTASESASWLEVIPTGGMLDPGNSVEIQVSLSSSAALLDPNVYMERVLIENVDSSSIKFRLATLTVEPPDLLTESFEAGDNDLAQMTLTFIPDGSISYYAACVESASAFPTDPGSGTYVTLADDDFAEVALENGAEISFFGQPYDHFYIGSNGYITFEQGDTEYNSTLKDHFRFPRISGVFTDLTPPGIQNISWQQLEDRVVVTYQDVPLYGDKTAKNNFQIEMFLADETIRITYLDLAATGGLSGLSQGGGMPAIFSESDLNAYLPCCACGDVTGDSMVNFHDLLTVCSYWLQDVCTKPDWCEKTDVDRNHIVDLADWTAFAQNWLLDSAATYAWSHPIHHTELNNPAESDARHPYLSHDKRTMYFRRITAPATGYIIEAHRDQPYGPFTSERVVTELGNSSAPWVSQDGLRMYYSDGDDNYTLKMAEWSEISQQWNPVRTFSELNDNNGIPTLTADELMILWYSSYGGSVKNWIATRSSIQEPFSNIIDGGLLNTGTKMTCISPDGLSIYSGDYDEITKASRTLRDAPFGDPVPILTASGETMRGAFVHITIDGQSLCFYRGDGHFPIAENGIWITELEQVEDYHWSESINLIEGGASPCLTRDELTMYYFRNNAQGESEIVEARRDHPRGAFTSERIITELPGAAQPWLSADALRLYYMVVDVYGDRVIKLAERSDTSQPWTPVRTISEIHVQGYDDHKPSLTEDELTIYWSSDQPPISGNPGIMMATRTIKSEPFSNVTIVSELNINDWHSAFCILPDGLTGYFHSNDNNAPWDIYKATKSSPGAPFGNITRLTINGESFHGHHPFVTPDESAIYFFNNRDANWTGITVSYWEKDINPCLPK